MTSGQDFIRPQDLAQFFAQEKSIVQQHLSVFLGRADGVLLFTHLADSLADEEQNSLGVLLASAWQASQAMTTYFSSAQADDFRYSFATADRGIYLLSFPWRGEAYFLATLYQKQDNPGAVKLLLRSMAQRLREFLGTLAGLAETTKPTAAGLEKPLFNDITDDEMNQLFAFAENP